MTGNDGLATGPRLPCSRSALDSLGRRLAAGTETPEDLLLLAEVLTVYDEVLAAAETTVRRVLARYTRMAGVEFSITTRVKTTPTIREKLQRERGMGLKGMQDIAGVRITGDMRRDQQDAVAALLLSEFFVEGQTRPPRLIDRRDHPSHGYRAVHVVANPEGIPLEIQIRSRTQDLWAQLLEKLADTWGRGIRYGEPPLEPDRAAVGEFSRSRIVAIVQAMGDELDEIERAEENDAQRVAELRELDEDAMVNWPDDERDIVLGRIQELRDEIEVAADLRLERRRELEETIQLLDGMTEAPQ